MIKVRPRGNESVQQLLKRFKRLCQREGLIRDMKRHSYYEKPSERRRRRKERRAQIRRETREAERTVKKETGHIPTATEALVSIRKVVAKDRTMFRKLQRTADAGLSRERAFGEANVCDRVIKLIDDELTKQRGDEP